MERDKLQFKLGGKKSIFGLHLEVEMDLHKSGLRAFQGGPNKQNPPLFLCLLIRNLIPFWTNIVLLKPNLKSKFIKKKICEKQGFSGPPRKKLAASIYAYPVEMFCKDKVPMIRIRIPS
jgi:hypothetical protein